MIKMSLHATQLGSDGFTPREVDTATELVIIEEMMMDGSPVQARSFTSPKGDNVTVFWTTDRDGRVATVWEHTYVINFNMSYGLAEESAVLQEADRVTVGSTSTEDPDGYSRGE